jgi:hypothetical protein
MSFAGGLAKIGVGFATGGLPGAAAAGATLLANKVGGGAGGGGNVEGAAAATNAALDAETMKAFANQLDHAKKEVAIQKVTFAAQEVQKAAQ